MPSRFIVTLCATAAAVIAAMPATARIRVKIGYIDPLSGGGASVGEVGLKTFQLSRRRTQRQGRHSRQEGRDRPARQQDQSAGKPDPGAEGDRLRHPLHHPGQRLGGRRRAVGFRHQIQRAQSRQGSAVLQLCRGRSDPDQREVQLLAFPLGRQLRHQDGSADQLHEDACRPSRRST